MGEGPQVCKPSGFVTEKLQRFLQVDSGQNTTAAPPVLVVFSQQEPRGTWVLSSLPVGPFSFVSSASVHVLVPSGLWTRRLQPPASRTEEEEAPRETGRPEQGHSERDGPEVL